MGIVRSHQGAFAVESELGVGTTFTILLPASGQAISPIEKSVNEVEIPAGRCVLITDDEQPIRETVFDILSQANVTVLMAKSGSQSIELFQRHQVDIHLIILD